MKWAFAALLVGFLGLATYAGAHQKRSRSPLAAPSRPAATASLHGLAGMLLASARQLPRASDRVTALEARLSGELDDSASRAAFIAFRVGLARNVHAGKIETTRLRQQVEAYKAADLALRARQAEAIRALHDVLGPTERRQVSEAMRASLKKNRESLPVASSGGQHEAALRYGDELLGQMKDRIRLDASQTEQARALLLRRDGSPESMIAERERMSEAADRQMDALLAEFERSEFVADHAPLSPIKDEPKLMIRQIEFVEGMMAILTPEQTGKLGDLLDEDPIVQSARSHGAKG